MLGAAIAPSGECVMEHADEGLYIWVVFFVPGGLHDPTFTIRAFPVTPTFIAEGPILV